MSKVIRAILTLALIYGAYTETGIFTALSLLLIFVALEAQGWLTRRSLPQKSCLKRLIGFLTRRASNAKPFCGKLYLITQPHTATA